VFLFGGRIVGHNWSPVTPFLVGVGAMKKAAATSVKRGGGQQQMPRVYSVKASDGPAADCAQCTTRAPGTLKVHDITHYSVSISSLCILNARNLKYSRRIHDYSSQEWT
jgi:hypothetical protein